jgi:2-polyprenyl-6-methoxyphenol hydroxylase-like FAD-dependent oxidoreductase
MSYDTHCCIVGGGPGGMVLALLLGRAGIQTTLLEEHEDFARDFRGDTVHPSTMELMDELGLADRLLQLPHAKIDQLMFDAPSGPVVLADLSRLRSKFPYITMMPQARFLDFLAGELETMPSVRLIMGAGAQGLLWEDPWGLSGTADRAPAPKAETKTPTQSTPPTEGTTAPYQPSPPYHGAPASPRPSEGEGWVGAAPASGAPAPSQNGAARPPTQPRPSRVPDADIARMLPADAIVRGVRYRARDGQHDLRAALTIGADGRFSRIRRLAGFELHSSSPPMDVIWFRLPRQPGDPEDARGKIGKGHLMVILNRGDEWQIAYVIAKGAYKEIHDAGLPAFRQGIADLAPEFADRVDHLQDWHQTSLLSVEAGRVETWFRTGLLLIGDAAHVMSPVGGVGINYAIQDAVVAANVLTGPLQRGRLHLSDLAAVQRQRELPTRIIQRIQRVAQERVVSRALTSDRPLRPPPIMQLPILRDVIPRVLGRGIWPVHLKG